MYKNTVCLQLFPYAHLSYLAYMSKMEWLVVIQREHSVIALVLGTEPIKLMMVLSRYQDMSPTNTSLKSNGSTKAVNAAWQDKEHQSFP